jgi:flagellin-like protein
MNYNKLYRKFKKNSKGLSPVVASIILIAVTVAVSVVVAAWMGGMTIGLMGSAEKVTITNVDFNENGAAADTLAVTVQNTGDTSVTISSAFVDNTEVESFIVDPTPIAKSETSTATLTVLDGTLAAGTQYTIKLVTQAGNSLVYSATYNGP